MTEFLLATLRRTPPAAWVGLAAIVVLGANQLRTRLVSAPRVVLVPLLLATYSLCAACAAFWRAGPALLLACWGAGFALGWAANRLLVLPRGVTAVGDGFRVEGSVLPLLLMLSVFVGRYVNGVALALEPARATQPGYAAVAALVFAVPAGIYAARGRRTWHARHAPSSLTAA